MLFKDEYDFLSNMYPCPVEIFGYKFTCSESAYQAAKCPSSMPAFTNMNGYQAKKEGRKLPIRKDWDAVKVNIMRTIVKAKFDQNPYLKERLVKVTGKIVEDNYWKDTFWGICNGVGQNMLGKILMEVRDEALKSFGAVYTCSMTNVNDMVQQHSIDEVWVIARSYKHPIIAPNGVPVYHVPELSPSRELLSVYLSMRDRGEWNFNSFVKTYVPRFLTEMLETQPRNRLGQIVKRTEEGKRILLVCYCSEEMMCHRSIVKGLLQGRGVRSEYFDYSRYFHIYMQMWRDRGCC